MKMVLLIASIVLFAIAAVFSFFGNINDLHTIIGLDSAGLAAGFASFLPIP